jgi:hypothetical protein
LSPIRDFVETRVDERGRGELRELPVTPTLYEYPKMASAAAAAAGGSSSGSAVPAYELPWVEKYVSRPHSCQTTIDRS